MEDREREERVIEGSEPETGEKLVEEVTFAIGDRVTCPSEFGDEVLTVTKTVAVSPGEKHLVRHSQRVIVEDSRGTEQPSKSGFWYKKA